jgi:hypothetical protein
MKDSAGDKNTSLHPKEKNNNVVPGRNIYKYITYYLMRQIIDWTPICFITKTIK